MHGSPWASQLAWVKQHSPLTRKALSLFPASPEVELLICFHIDLKMIPVIVELGQRVHLKVIPCNKTTVDPEGWQYLRGHSGIELLELEEALSGLKQPVGKQRRFLCDLGGELVCHCLKGKGTAEAAMEGTTSGMSRILDQLDGRPPDFPILDWNAAFLKRAVHNEKMVGFSLWQTFCEVTRLSLHGKTVGVLGFGLVGRGIARTARHLGGTVAIYDPDPAARTLAAFEGFPALPREELLAGSQVVVTATGRSLALRVQDLELLSDGVFLLNAGHGCDEIDLDIREHPKRREVLRHVEEIALGDRHCYLLARGELTNLAAGFGDTINGFDLTSAQLVQSVRYMVEGAAARGKTIFALPRELMNEIL